MKKSQIMMFLKFFLHKRAIPGPKYCKILMMLLKSLLHKRAIAITLIPGVSIFILEFTAFRPFGYNRYAININRLILTLSYTLIGSGLFYYVNVILPSIWKNDMACKHIHRQIKAIKEELQLIVMFDIEPFCMSDKKYNTETFAAKFRSINLYDDYGFRQNVKDRIEQPRKRIEAICTDLMGNYMQELTPNQIRFIDFIMTSYFMNNQIQPIEYSLPDHLKDKYPNNQNEIGISIFSLYSISTLQ